MDFILKISLRSSRPCLNTTPLDPCNTKMAEEHSLVRTTKVDWSVFASQAKTIPSPIFTKPVIYVKQEPVEDGYEHFRQLSHKVARCRYDIPWGHSIVIAYATSPGSIKSPEAIGAVTFKVGDSNLQCPNKAYNFMDDFYHKISFLFVEKEFQRIGVGSLLVKEAIKIIRESDMTRPVRLEGAKSAVKFFRKLGFLSDGKIETACSRRGSRLFWEYYYMQLPV